MLKSPVSKKFMLGSMYMFLVNGILVLMTSSILVYLMQDYHLDYDQGGMLLSIQSIGNLLANFFSGPLSTWIGRKKTLILSSACFAIGFAGVALTPPLYLLYLALFISGLGWGSANNLVNFLLVRATAGDSGKMALVHTCFSVGAFVAPLLVGSAVQYGLSWQLPVAGVAVLSVLLIAVNFFMPIDESGRNRSRQGPINLSFLKNWRFYLYLMILFLYVGIEMGFSSWLVTYLTTRRHFQPTAAQSLLSLLWICMIAGRTCLIFIGSKVNKATFLMLETLGAVLSAILLVSSASPGMLALSVALMGLSLSGIYSMVLSNANDLVAESSSISGTMMSFGGLGSTVLPLLAGMIAQRSGIITGLWSLIFMALVMLLLAIANVIGLRRMISRNANF